jgi:hypothetical protein
VLLSRWKPVEAACWTAGAAADFIQKTASDLLHLAIPHLQVLTAHLSF